MAETGLYIGRFQPFHLGHLEVVKYVLGRVNRIVIAIGSAQYSHTLENPFTAGERITMIEHALDEAGISPGSYLVVPIPDMNVHKLWVAQVVSQTPEFHVVYSNEPLTVTLFMEAGFKVEAIPFFSREEYSATEIRKRMINRQEWATLVPRSVAEYIRGIKGDTRLRNLSGSDKLPKL
jgi:nicotinamide-nucleotide adenylyltransferase